MGDTPDSAIGRRDLLRLVTSVGVAATALIAAPVVHAESFPKPKDRGKRKSQYQPNAPEVQRFYRVNSYPKK